MTWSLYEDKKELKPLVFSNGKSQADIVADVITAVKEGYKIIFIKGICGTGKSAIALNLARKFGKTSIVVPIKSLQQQYVNDYTKSKYVLKSKFNINTFQDLDKYPNLANSERLKNLDKLNIVSIVGRNNFKCKYLEENKPEFRTKNERNTSLAEVFAPKVMNKHVSSSNNKSCDNDFLPCKIEIKEKNMDILKDYIKKNPDVKITDFETIKEIKRMTIAPICPYWSPVVPNEYEMKRFKDAVKVTYNGLNSRKFSIYYRKNGCPYYEQYKGYADADVLIFNSLKYKIETLLDRKPATELEIIDECDDFLDSFAVEESINLNRLSYALNAVFSKDEKTKKTLERLNDIISTIKISTKYTDKPGEFYDVKSTIIEDLLRSIIGNTEFLEDIEIDESSYLYHLDEVSKTFASFLDETFFTIEKKDNNFIVNLVTTNLEKRFKELVEKNKILVLMSGTIHSDSVLRSIFGLEKFKIIEAETKHQGELIMDKKGFEVDCSYDSFKWERVTREQYLKNLSRCVDLSKKPTLVHVNSFSDLPNQLEKMNFKLDNLPTQEELIEEQQKDPLGTRVKDFRDKKFPVLFTTKCNRGIDFPGDTCNSIIVTRFPYPNISGIFWKILKRKNPQHFMSFYMDKAKRELLQKIYRGLRSKDDKVCLLSPDIRVLNFKFD